MYIMVYNGKHVYNDIHAYIHVYKHVYNGIHAYIHVYNGIHAYIHIIVCMYTAYFVPRSNKNSWAVFFFQD